MFTYGALFLRCSYIVVPTNMPFRPPTRDGLNILCTMLQSQALRNKRRAGYSSYVLYCTSCIQLHYVNVKPIFPTLPHSLSISYLSSSIKRELSALYIAFFWHWRSLRRTAPYVFHISVFLTLIAFLIQLTFFFINLLVS